MGRKKDIRSKENDDNVKLLIDENHLLGVEKTFL